MKTHEIQGSVPQTAGTEESTSAHRNPIPAWLRWGYTAFMAVLVPVYWANYGPTNFLYFCDVALFLTLVGVWTGRSLLISMPAVGILLPQALWCADFVAESFGWPLVGMTSYMFDENRSLFLRGLSLFHGWLPFLLLFLVRRVGYDARALKAWTAVAWLLCVVSFLWIPPAGAAVPDAKIPVNVNYVWGFDDAKPQSWMPSGWYLVLWMTALAAVVYLPTHWMLSRWAAQPADSRSTETRVREVEDGVVDGAVEA